MPNASAHEQSNLVKALLLGDSATGKTTALWSLVDAGYKLRVYDFDNLLASLIAKIKRDTPTQLNQLEFMSFRDTFKTTPNGPICAAPRAYIDFLKALDEWEDGSIPSEWGPDFICVIDSFTSLSRSAQLWGRAIQGGGTFAEGVPMKGFDGRAAFYTSQQSLMNVVAMLTAASFNTNVIVIAHLKYLERDGVTKGYPLSIGQAISPEIPTYFPTVMLAERSSDDIRTLRTASTRMIDLKNPKSFEIAPQMPLETGLAEFFKASRE